MQPTKVRNRIGRTFYYTKCYGTRIKPDNSDEDFELVLEGNIQNIERATKQAQKHYGSKRVIVRTMEHFKVYESAPIEKFHEIVDQKTVILED